VQLFVGKSARRIVSFLALILFSVPFGITVTGCKHATAPVYCNGGDSGPVVGQVQTITVSSTLATYGESLNYGQIGQQLSASATDCHGTSVSVSKYIYAINPGYNGINANSLYADINPSTGQVCGGTWNRNTGGGIPDYTTCTAPATTPTGYYATVTATAVGGVGTSNIIPIFVHAPPNKIEIGSASTNCSTDPSTNCCPLTYTAPQPAMTYDGTSCLSQGYTGQLVARVYDTSGNNITCQVGHLTFAPVGSTNIVAIDENGVATAGQPGSATITASVAGSSSSSTAGFFSTCPPASIVLTSNGSPNPITSNLNVATPFSAVVKDTNGNPITGLSLEYESTTPQTIPAGSNSITPLYPGSATITAVCQPPGCNPAPYSQIDYLSNGTPLTSNGIQLTATGPSSSVIYVGSTSSQYIYPYDFTTNQGGGLLKLPYTPNSMVISDSGADIYLGSPQALMVVSTANNSLTAAYTTLTGSVISISPDASTLVVTDPVRQTTSLVSASNGAVDTTIAGVANSAAWSPDSETVYITTQQSASYGPQVLIHSLLTSWTAYNTQAFTDVTVTVPHIGAYFAGAITEGRSYCPASTLDTSTSPATVTNTFYPPVQDLAVPNQQIAATNDKAHVLGAESGTPAVLNDLSTTGLPYTTQCPEAPATPPAFNATNTVHPLAGITASSITGVDPSSNSETAFVTYIGSSAAAGQLPLYIPSSGAVDFVKLSGAATDPVAGVFSSDNSFFYAGTAGDDDVHIITMTYPTSGTPTAVDTGTLTPNLVDANGNPAVPNLIVQRVKKPTS
jgi:hypothetical protein